MKTTIDGAGRLVVPKPLRETLGFEPGRKLEVRAVDGRLEVEIAPTPMRLSRRGKSVVAVADRKLPTLTVAEVRRALDSVRR